jgi:hypothetical protein
MHLEQAAGAAIKRAGGGDHLLILFVCRRFFSSHFSFGLSAAGSVVFCLEVVSRPQIMFESKAQAGEKVVVLSIHMSMRAF